MHDIFSLSVNVTLSVCEWNSSRVSEVLSSFRTPHTTRWLSLFFQNPRLTGRRRVKSHENYSYWAAEGASHQSQGSDWRAAAAAAAEIYHIHVLKDTIEKAAAGCKGSEVRPVFPVSQQSPRLIQPGQLTTENSFSAKCFVWVWVTKKNRHAHTDLFYSLSIKEMQSSPVVSPKRSTLNVGYKAHKYIHTQSKLNLLFFYTHWWKISTLGVR